MAKLGQREQMREKLEAWHALPRPLSAGLTAREFDDVRSEPWFLDVVLAVLSKEYQGRAPPQIAQDLQRLGLEFVDLRITAAGPDRVIGKLAVWEGIVLDARIDDGGEQMLLFAEAFDAQLRVVESRPDVSRYEIVHTLEEQFVPNGRGFLVLVEGADPKVLELKVVTVVGKIIRGPDGKKPPPTFKAVSWKDGQVQLVSDSPRWPAVEARLIFPRVPQRSEKRVRAY
jgi:hypothetical protein